MNCLHFRRHVLRDELFSFCELVTKRTSINADSGFFEGTPFHAFKIAERESSWMASATSSRIVVVLKRSSGGVPFICFLIHLVCQMLGGERIPDLCCLICVVGFPVGDGSLQVRWVSRRN